MAIQRFCVTIALLAAASLAACAPPASIPPPVSNNPPSTVILYNISGQTVCYVYIVSITSGAWPEDLLGTDTIAAGAQRAFFVEPDIYDLIAKDCQHNVLDQRFDVEISDSYEWHILPPKPSPTVETATVILHNQSGQTICYAYMDILGGGDWTDRLGTDVIPDGQVYTFTLPAGFYDISLEDCDHNPVAREQMVQIAGIRYWTVSGEDDSTTPPSSSLSKPGDPA
jgi:hypothetical protein